MSGAVTPEMVGAMLHGRRTDGTVIAELVEALEASPDWQVDTLELAGPHVTVQALYLPRAEWYTMTARRSL